MEFSILIIFLIMLLVYIKMPKAKKQEITAFDALLNTLRDILKKSGNSFVDNFSDDEIQQLAKIVFNKFDVASLKRNEFITGNQKLKILNEIIYVYGLKGKEFAFKHLEYEANRYIIKGLRKDNKGLL